MLGFVNPTLGILAQKSGENVKMPGLAGPVTVLAVPIAFRQVSPFVLVIALMEDWLHRENVRPFVPPQKYGAIRYGLP